MSASPPAGVGLPNWKTRFTNRFLALRHRNYRLFWTGHAVSVIGTWMQNIAIFWLVYRLTDSPFMLGLVGVSIFLPILCFSLIGGVVADRVDRRRLVLSTQILHFIQACTLAVLVTFGDPTAPQILFLALVQGTINAFDFPARQSFLSELVPKADLTNAIALNSMAFNMARLIGPAIGGVLLATVGEAACFWLNASSYFLVLWNLQKIRLPVRERIEEEHPIQRLKEGLAYAFGIPKIRNLVILLGLVSTLGFQYIVLLPIYARDILNSGAGGYGILMTAAGIGSLSAFFHLTSRLDRPAMRRNVLIGLISLGLGLILFSFSKTFWVSMAFSLMIGLGMILYTVTTNMMIQTTVKDEYRGRVMSLFTIMLVGTSPLGAFVIGALAERFGAPVATRISGAACILGAIWVVNRLRILAQREAELPANENDLEQNGDSEADKGRLAAS